ncbi:MAG: alcohol dehydrogenase catalytic domain-containing protein [Clostridiales bacterium]|nr:alcohol dehydrogenase catalytic domain-containing protein [Clostridiales bacterium]
MSAARPSMRAAVYYNNRDIRLEERPVPAISADELLVKVMASSICGSDVLEWYRIKQAPRVLGHEIAGVVVESGERVKKFKTGDRVTVTHHVPCNTCRYCLSGHATACDTLHRTNFDPGGFAEYVRVPWINVDRGTFLLPPEISFEEGTFVEPLACVLRGQKVARIRPGQTLLVLGSGVSGILHIKLAAATGAGRIIATDISSHRMEMARKFGAEYVFHAQELTPDILRVVNEGGLAERVIVCAGSLAAAEQALECVDRGGTILFFAVPHPDDRLVIPISEFWRNDITLLTSYAADAADLTETIELLRNKRVRVADMISHRFSLCETGLGFSLMEKADESLKIIIEPHRKE